MSTSPHAGDAAPTGWVTLIVGELGRATKGGGQTRPAAAQWSCLWSADSPGAVAPGNPEGGQADLALSMSPADAELVGRGELAPSVAFMQGRLKTTGDNALLLRVLAWSATPAFATYLASWVSAEGKRQVDQEPSGPGANGPGASGPAGQP
jgi:hypothetical protein